MLIDEPDATTAALASIWAEAQRWCDSVASSRHSWTQPYKLPGDAALLTMRPVVRWLVAQLTAARVDLPAVVGSRIASDLVAHRWTTDATRAVAVHAATEMRQWARHPAAFTALARDHWQLPVVALYATPEIVGIQRVTWPAGVCRWLDPALPLSAYMLDRLVHGQDCLWLTMPPTARPDAQAVGRFGYRGLAAPAIFVGDLAPGAAWPSAYDPWCALRAAGVAPPLTFP